ncbi:MMPL family transporter [Streptomyces meridianus]|uniref:MMPL family transporter n=1 Tax=Streptomyces meridianus TaxID=2938945 RepID=A0ABT0X9Y2_9ACTN|nr:MMPL family transporter [Streptomyces meridianus]MCM2579340.1 MMPL family transporter [Streptomyces meridianus]
MADLLYRIGRSGFRRRGLVTAIWLVLLGALIAGVAAVGKAPTSGVTIPGTESQRALDALAHEFPEAGGASGTVVVRAPAGESLLEPENRRQVLTTVREANELPGVLGAMSPYDTRAIGKDGRYTLLSVQFAETADRLTDRERSAYEDLGADAPEGWRIAAGGEPLFVEPEVGSTEGIGVAVALVVLVITFGSLMAAGMTMVNALAGVGAGMAGITMVGHTLDMSATAPVPALMPGLAVGIDYSLFIPHSLRGYPVLQLGEETHPWPGAAKRRRLGAYSF